MQPAIEIRVPDIGDFKDIPVLELLVKPGDLVELDQPIVTLESDKATLDVPSPSAGRVAALAVGVGTKVSVGSLLMTLHASADAIVSLVATPSLPRVAPPPVPVVPAFAPALPPDTPPIADATALSHGGTRIYASPSIRRMGRQLGADLANMTGSGRGGRILMEDLHNSVRKVMEKEPTAESALPAASSARRIDFSKFGEIERKPLSRIRRLSGTALARNWATIPHVTNFDEADITDLEAFRVTLNKELAGEPKITVLAFLVKAAAATLKAIPAFNSSLDGQELILKKYVHVGVAVDSADGLVVPVIRDADQLGILNIARTLAVKATAARSGKLKSGDFEGGCFTISSLGGVGGTGFTPIINSPEIAILGVARATIQPRWDGGKFEPRLILPLALSWDHRATDGVAAARFLVHFVALLSDFRRVLL